MAKKNEKQRRKEAKGESAQSFLPIRDIRNGIVETTDGRYLKILEIEPINFALRSSEEQFNIISSFASWLKISPIRLQCKTITRRADSDKHIALVKEELAQEENPQCRALGEDYLRLIQDVGSREALTRRFFLIFQYEAVGRDDGDYTKIYSSLQGAEQTARAYFLQCGNGIVQPANPDEATAGDPLPNLQPPLLPDRAVPNPSGPGGAGRHGRPGLTLGLDPVPGNPRGGIPGAPGHRFHSLQSHHHGWAVLLHPVHPGKWLPQPGACRMDVRTYQRRRRHRHRHPPAPGEPQPGHRQGGSAHPPQPHHSRGCRIPAPTTRSWPIPSRQAISSKTASPITTRICFI